MDAQLVWNTWRRILQDDSLAERVTDASSANVAALNDLDAAESAILADYARTPQATATNIGMYRRGLVRNALAALSRVPMSRHLLYTSGLDVEDVAADFARANGYSDDGPNFWRVAGAFVGFLATRPEFASPAHQDVLELDRDLVALARRLGTTTVALWPDAAANDGGEAARRDHSNRRFVASPAAAVATSRHDLTSWIENPQGYDPAEPLAVSQRRWLIYFPAAESAPGYAELSERSGRVFDLLETAKSADDVSHALGSLSATEALTVIHNLAELGAVVGEEAA